MVRGWFIGGFSPTAYKTTDCEVAVQEYNKGDIEEKHYHKIATEITVVLEGKIKMCGLAWKKGDIVIVDPGESTGFEALTKCTNLVVKIPGALNDKYLLESNKIT